MVWKSAQNLSSNCDDSFLTPGNQFYSPRVMCSDLTFTRRPLALKIGPWEFLENMEFCRKSLKIVKILLFGKRCSRTLSGRHASTEKDRALWFFLLDHNGQTWIYRLVWGPTEVRFRRNRDFPTEDDNCAPPGKLGLRYLLINQSIKKKTCPPCPPVREASFK